MKIVYYCFAGRYSDSPRAIYEKLAGAGDGRATHLWLADPKLRDTFPADVETVLAESEQAVRALESADAVVANIHLELEWEKRPGTFYLQTWHGTPLKRLHTDNLSTTREQVESLDCDIRCWDALLSPNHASTGALLSAFRFTGETAETGYPRNDVLTGPHRDEIRARTRRDLRIPDSSTAVLYAPTWRDDVVDEHGNLDFELHLDPEEFARRLGKDHVLLLRPHYKVADRLGDHDGAAVRDVAQYPEISDLYLAADVMVTDYSSTLFDFALTGKPMLFYTYDLEHYRDSVRGFYFDFPALAPGPLLRTGGEVLEALSCMDSIQAQYRGAYASFREKFCHLEDGHATERVVQRYFPEVAPGSPYIQDRWRLQADPRLTTATRSRS